MESLKAEGVSNSPNPTRSATDFSGVSISETLIKKISYITILYSNCKTNHYFYS